MLSPNTQTVIPKNRKHNTENTRLHNKNKLHEQNEKLSEKIFPSYLLSTFSILIVMYNVFIQH